jgi:hypothetical protein
MSDFMNSEFVQNEMDEVQRLQKKIFEDLVSYDNLDREDKLKHLENFEELIELQSILYTRMSLSDDPEAIERRETIQDFLMMMTFENSHDVHAVFADMKNTIAKLREDLDT